MISLFSHVFIQSMGYNGCLGITKHFFIFSYFLRNGMENTSLTFRNLNFLALDKGHLRKMWIHFDSSHILSFENLILITHYFPPLFIKTCPWYFPNINETICIPLPVSLNGLKHSTSGLSNSFMSSLFFESFCLDVQPRMLSLAHRDFGQCTSLK